MKRTNSQEFGCSKTCIYSLSSTMLAYGWSLFGPHCSRDVVIKQFGLYEPAAPPDRVKLLSKLKTCSSRGCRHFYTYFRSFARRGSYVLSPFRSITVFWSRSDADGNISFLLEQHYCLSKRILLFLVWNMFVLVSTAGGDQRRWHAVRRALQHFSQRLADRLSWNSSCVFAIQRGRILIKLEI